MMRFNRRAWLLSVRASELADIDPALLPAALALQAAVIADGLTDQPAWEDYGAGARRAHRRAARLSRPDPRRPTWRAHVSKRSAQDAAALPRRLSPG